MVDRRVIAALVSMSWLAGCGGDDAPFDGPAGVLAIDVTALSLSGVGDVVWDLEVDNGGGQVVWQRRVTSSGYGDGGGSASYVGTCDAGTGVSQNTVKVWVVGVYAAAVTSAGSFASGSSAGPGAVIGAPVAFQSPTVTGPLTRSVACVENQDAAVQLDVALMRPAQQGFFDVAVNFNDIFCSAKLDCCHDTDVDGDCDADIALLFDAGGGRDATFVLGFACTAGARAGVATELYLEPLRLDCTDPSAATFAADVTVNPSGANGNQCAAGAVSGCAAVAEANGVDADAYLFQVGVYRGVEQLSSGGVDARKVYWNVALGVRRPAIDDCWLTTRGTADDALGTSAVDGGSVGAGTVYPYVVWEADLAECVTEPLAFGDAGAMVRPAYTATTGAALGFQYAYGPSVDHCDPNPCQHGGACTTLAGGFTCACVNGWTGASCAAPPAGFTCAGAACENAATGELWVPFGTFWMGCSGRAEDPCLSDELLQHEVTLSSYAIDKNEVTVAEYGACVSASACSAPGTGIFANWGVVGKEQHPVNWVSNAQSAAYCAWTEQRLCSEAEWERAARGGCETVTGDCATRMRKYPWDAGNGSAPTEPTCSLANYFGGSGETDYCEPATLTAVVGSRPAGASPYGALDMAGNLWEWVADNYANAFAGTPVTDPPGPGPTGSIVLRGGYFSESPAGIRASNRTGVPDQQHFSFGFRCCRTVP